VASKDSPSHFQESPNQYRGNVRGIGLPAIASPGQHQQPTQSQQQCYVTYPYEPTYYTHHQAQQYPPPAYGYHSRQY